MTREEMIAILHTLPFAYVDDLPDAGFTERPLWVNDKGYGYLSCDDPSDQCWEGEGLELERWEIIKHKLSTGKLLLEDLKETSLLELLDIMYCPEFPIDEDPCEYLQGLLTLPDGPLNCIYCMNSIDGWQFFASEEEFQKAYERDWCDYTWDELSDGILEQCIEQLSEEGLLRGEYLIVSEVDDVELNLQEFLDSLDTSYLVAAVDTSEFEHYFDDVCMRFSEYLLDTHVDTFYDMLDSFYPDGSPNGNLSYYGAYNQFISETKANILKKYGNSFLRLIAKSIDGSPIANYSISVAELLNEVLEKNTEYGEFDVIIGTYIEASLQKFVKSSRWHLGYYQKGGTYLEINSLAEYGKVQDKSCPRLWFGMNGDKPIEKWMVAPQKEHSFVWMDPWYLLEFLIDDCNDCFATWYLAECGNWLPDMGEILEECPIQISDEDTDHSINEKILSYFSAKN